MSDVKPKVTISLWKGVKLALIVLGAKLVTPDAVANALPAGYGELSVAVALAAVINYAKTKFNLKV